jgi:TonB family protein
LTVDASGEVSSVEVVTGVDPGLDAAIVAALQRWRFKPAMACGKPIAGGTFVVTRTFELGD